MVMHAINGLGRLLSKIMFFSSVFFIAVSGVGDSVVKAEETESPIPGWILIDWATRTSGSATWVAENSRRSERAPYDSYAMHWEYGPGNTTLKGRLYAIQDGKDVRTLWEFLEYWNPDKQKRITVQYGYNPDLGFLGLGEAEEPAVIGEHVSTSRIFALDGSSYLVGHRSKTIEGVNTSRSFNIVDGEWQKRGEFVWRLQE